MFRKEDFLKFIRKKRTLVHVREHVHTIEPIGLSKLGCFTGFTIFLGNILELGTTIKHNLGHFGSFDSYELVKAKYE